MRDCREACKEVEGVGIGGVVISACALELSVVVPLGRFGAAEMRHRRSFTA
jgi:hypothetical protein